MALWISYTHEGKPGFGQVEGDRVIACEGEMFGDARRTESELALADVRIDLPCRPGKFIALWNNYHAQAAKQNLAIPAEPLYFIKTPNSYCAHEHAVPSPIGYDGRVVYEGELGVVIGSRCKNANEQQARQAIFGYTCVNDITALDLIAKDASFAQWTRAKCFDGFGVFGPAIATGLDWQTLNVRTLLNGRERQNYPCNDMIFSPAEIVHALSQDMTLEPGDLIACGTSLGVLPMKSGAVVEVHIEGIGTLRNTYGGSAPA
ncbi:MAG TPA: fumarylacetoacetate hydrolase family protein [Gallionella sp.]|nr:fumarylacetoacetate hydrolase family protein [Gallionella sp.]